MRTNLTAAAACNAEMERLKAVSRRKLSTAEALAAWAGTDGADSWTEAARAWDRICRRVMRELECIEDEGRRAKQRELLSNSVLMIVHPASLAVDSAEICAKYAGANATMQLELLDDVFQARRRFAAIEKDQAALLADEIAELVASIRMTASTEVDAFAIEKLEELRRVLQRFSYYGAEGVDDLVVQILGKLTSLKMRGTLAAAMVLRANDIAKVLKRAADIVVYGAALAGAIETAGVDVPLLNND